MSRADISFACVTARRQRPFRACVDMPQRRRTATPSAHLSEACWVIAGAFIRISALFNVLNSAARGGQLWKRRHLFALLA